MTPWVGCDQKEGKSGGKRGPKVMFLVSIVGQCGPPRDSDETLGVCQPQVTRKEHHVSVQLEMRHRSSGVKLPAEQDIVTDTFTPTQRQMFTGSYWLCMSPVLASHRPNSNRTHRQL